MTLPTFFIIGAAKAGTGSLAYYLNQHPEIQMSAVKEPKFFLGSPGEIPHPTGGTVVSRLDEYESLFDPGFRVRGEASVGYSNFPRRKGVPAAIRELVPAARFVYLVRDPVARTVSQYRYRVAFEGERRPLQEALSDLSDPYSVYLGPSRYASQLEVYLREFPADRVLVVDHADLLAERRATLREIFGFLEVDAEVDSSAFGEELNRSSENLAYSMPYVRLQKRVASSPLRLLPRGVRKSARGRLERLMWSPVPPAELDDELRGRLQELYAPEVERLRELTGKSFPSWEL